MKRGKHLLLFVVVASIVLLFAGGLFFPMRESTSVPPVLKKKENIAGVARRSEPITPLPHAMSVDEHKAALGERLFSDTALSSDDTISCATCHVFTLGGTDRFQYSVGVGGAIGVINAPTVFNAVFNIAQFWDGRAQTLEEQANGSVTNPVEMNANWPDIIVRLQGNPGYVAQFEAIYPSVATPISKETIIGAIAEFMRTLITPDAPFDHYLRGEALSDDALAGYVLFKDYGCSSCHQGVNIGGNMFQRFGVMGDYFTDRGNLTQADFGRYNVTNREVDRYVFKVPTLRNVALTPPYFHDGSIQTLEEAVIIMGRYQLGRELSDEDVRVLLAFLNSLTGKFRGQPLK